MADYDLSKPAPDRSRDAGTGSGGLGFILVGAAIVLVVLYAVFGGAAVPVSQDPEDVVAPQIIAPGDTTATPAPAPEQ